MSDSKSTDAVVKTADQIIDSPEFGDKLEAVIAKAIAANVKPHGGTDNGTKLFAPASHDKHAEVGSTLGATIVALAKCKNDREKTIRYANDKYGEGNPVTRGLVGKSLRSDTTGGMAEAVQTTVSSEVIEALRPNSIVRQSNPRIVSNPTGTLNITRVATGVTGGWIGEATARSAEQQVTDTVQLTHKKAKVAVPYTRELLMFATPDVEMAIAEDVVAAMGQLTDSAYIRGSGTSNTPQGIRYQVATASNVITSTGTSASAVETDIANLLQAIRGANVTISPETGFFWMSSRSFTFLEKLRDSNGNLIFPELRMETPRLMRYRVLISNNIPDNIASGGSPSSNESEVYFGHGPSIFIADAIDLSLQVLENVAYTDSTGTLVSANDRDEYVIDAILMTDLALRHTVAWAVLDDVAWGA